MKPDAMNLSFEKILSRAKAPLSAALILLLLTLQTLAVSKALHEDVHTDAAHVDHKCAVTLLSSGQVDLSGPEATLSVAPEFIELIELSAGPAIHCRPNSLPSSRGPPSVA
jgi:hypothetical protein